MDHDESLEADPVVESDEECIDRRRVADVDPGPPGMCDVDADPDVPSVDPALRETIADEGELVERRPEPAPATRRVLEDEHRVWGATGRSRQRLLDAVDEPADPDLDAGTAVRPDVYVDEARPGAWRCLELRGEDRHGAIEGRGIRPW